MNKKSFLCFQILFRQDRNKVLRALGSGNAKPEISPILSLGEDEHSFLLCTDGFYRNLGKEELCVWNRRKINNSEQADRMLKQIFHKKIAAGEQDNISALYFGYIEKRLVFWPW